MRKKHQLRWNRCECRRSSVCGNARHLLTQGFQYDHVSSTSVLVYSYCRCFYFFFFFIYEVFFRWKWRAVNQHIIPNSSLNTECFFLCSPNSNKLRTCLTRCSIKLNVNKWFNMQTNEKHCNNNNSGGVEVSAVTSECRQWYFLFVFVCILNLCSCNSQNGFCLARLFIC